MSDTKGKILKAATVEFATMGFDGASIRSITKRAGVNVASVNYHFGSKEALFKEMVRERCEPINEKRLAMLDDAIEANGGKPLHIKKVVDILVRPLMRELTKSKNGEYYFMRALARYLGENHDFMREMEESMFKETIAKFAQALSNSMGSPPETDLYYALHFISSSLAGNMMHQQKLKALSSGKLDHQDINTLIDKLVVFLAGGLTALIPSQP